MLTARSRIHTPIGPVVLESDGKAVRRVVFGPERGPLPEGVSDPLLERAAREILEYLDGRRRCFEVPVRYPGDATAFQRRVWDALRRIPYGTIRTYGELARELGTSPRAVGGACARNPIPILVPCHRVVARGGLGGFAGQWETGLALDVKRRLLALEGVIR